MSEPITFVPKFIEPKRPLRILSKTLILLCLLLLSGTVLGYIYFTTILDLPSQNFPTDVAIVIEEGMSAKEATRLLAENSYVKSETALYLVLILKYDPSRVKAGTYVFKEPLTTTEIAKEITTGNFVNNLIKITHIEGERATHLAKKVAELLPNFDQAVFLALAKEKEGYLFPDTYLVPTDFTATDLLKLMTDTFTERILPLEDKIGNHSLSLPEIITLASILEREANTPESRKIVSGILQKRLAIGMALQVDASIEYVLDKELGELTAEDLKQDTPYNTYLYPGLPPTPIGNPGLEAIEAVLEPAPSNYLFYITGNDGEFYYAKNFDEHRINIARHLR